MILRLRLLNSWNGNFQWAEDKRNRLCQFRHQPRLFIVLYCMAYIIVIFFILSRGNVGKIFKKTKALPAFRVGLVCFAETDHREVHQAVNAYQYG